MDGLNYNDIKTAQTNPDGTTMTRDQIASTAQASTSTLPVQNLQTNNLQNGTSIPAIPLPNSISSNDLATVPKVSIPTAQPSTPAPSMNIADKILQETQVPDTTTQKNATDLSNKIYNLLPNLQGQAAELATQQKAAGVDTLKKDLQDLNTAILTKQAEIGQDDTKLVASMRAEEVRNSLLPFVQSGQAKLAGDAAILRGLKTSEIGVLNARAIAKQGDIQLAIETAQNAVDAKYAPYKEAIDIYKQQLDALAPILSRDDKKQADAQQLKTTLALQDLEDARATEKADAALIFSSGLPQKFVNKSGTFIRTSDNKHYDNPDEFFLDAGIQVNNGDYATAFKEAYNRGLIGDLSPQLIADKDFVMNLRNTYPDAGIDYTDSAEQAAQKVNDNSYIYGKATYMDKADPNAGPNIQTIEGADGSKHSVIWDPTTQSYIDAGQLIDGNSNSTTQEADKTDALGKVNQINNLLNNSGLNSVVGPNGAARWSIINSLTGKSAAAIGDIQQITTQMALDKLIQSKAQGATFGALSDAELRLLAESATKINNWAIKNKDGQVTGYNIDEGSFRTELKKIQDGIKKAYDLKYGSGATPAPGFNSAGNASASTTGNQEKGMKETLQKLPLLNYDGSTKTPNIPLTKAYPQGSYPAGKANSLANQCGYFVRSVVNKMGLTYPTVGDTLTSKVAAVQKFGTKIGGIGKVLITNESKKTGHVAYVIGQNAKGWVLSESNFKLDGKVNYGRVIPYNSPNIIGFLQPTKKTS